MLEKLRKIKKENFIIAYKLLHDVLFVVLLFFLLALLAEGALPGIITSHIGFSKVIILIFLIIFAIYALGNYLKINISATPTNKKTAVLLLFILALLIFNSLFKLNIFLNILILLAVLATGYFLYKATLEE